MATTIRLTRMGRKKRPFYRLVVLDSRKRRDGAYLANLGYYNPFTEPHEIEIHADEIIEWMGKGATVSETAKSLLRNEGVLYRFSLVKQGLDPAKIRVISIMPCTSKKYEISRSQEMFASGRPSKPFQTFNSSADGMWVIDGKSFSVTAEVELDEDHGPIAAGTCVELEMEEGDVKEIESTEMEKCQPKQQ